MTRAGSSSESTGLCLRRERRAAASVSAALRHQLHQEAISRTLQPENACVRLRAFACQRGVWVLLASPEGFRPGRGRWEELWMRSLPRGVVAA
eukprot:738167-Rhodomonas_salina.1